MLRHRTFILAVAAAVVLPALSGALQPVHTLATDPPPSEVSLQQKQQGGPRHARAVSGRLPLAGGAAPVATHRLGASQEPASSATAARASRSATQPSSTPARGHQGSPPISGHLPLPGPSLVQGEDVGAPIDDFPAEPPVQLVAPSEAPKGLLLGGGPVTTATEGMRVHRNMMSWTGRDLMVSAPNGDVLYQTEGDLWTMKALTHFFVGSDINKKQAEIVVFTKTIWAIHKIYEVHSYEPICPEQEAESERGTDDRKLYPYARLTEYLLTSYDHYLLERYNCDGSLYEFWDINTRAWFSFYKQFDVRQASLEGKAAQGTLIGTIDQAYFFQLSPNYNAFLAKNVDRTLFAIVAVLVDIAELHKASGSSSGSSSGGGGGGGGARR